jgi:hypothetical protein
MAEPYAQFVAGSPRRRTRIALLGLPSPDAKSAND